MVVQENWLDEENCCQMYKSARESKWLMGSHYHCPRCWAVTGMYGHHTSMHFVDGKSVNVGFHRCCPDYCELTENPDV